MPKYNIINMPGPGDRETWGDTSHDPRSPEYDPGPHLECAVCERNTADYEGHGHVLKHKLQRLRDVRAVQRPHD